MNGRDAFLHLANARAVRAADVPDLGIDAWRAEVIAAVEGGGRIAALFATAAADGRQRLYAVLAHGDSGELGVASAQVRTSYDALTPDCPQAHWFEREIYEQSGIEPRGHPWLKPIRYRRGAGAAPDVTAYFRVAGDGIHEVAVGPVHAGVIEPGHFRFQCYGENVLHLEIALGYQHRGVERALVGGPTKRTVHYMETLAGDTTVGHALAYATAVEALARCAPPLHAEVLRSVGLELERLANHTGDLGALAADVGYLPSASYCGRIRGDFLNLTAEICGSRFGRGLVRPGGCGFSVERPRAERMLDRLRKAALDVRIAADLLWHAASVRARFEDTGRLSAETARELGLVGVAARACGLARDVRTEFPLGVYSSAPVPISTAATGDVHARAYVRWLEIQTSIEHVQRQLASLQEGAARVDCAAPAPEMFVVTLVEAWRGEICHVALTDAAGRFAHYKVVDPSFHNWFGLAMALRDQQISDFPLCNKSFNLSYCGHDL